MIALEFGTIDDARRAREQHPDALGPRDDARTKTVRLDEDDLTDRELDQLVAEAEAGRAEREGTGQLPLTDRERSSIDFTQPRANVPHARSVKAIFAAAGVEDWLARYDPSLTVDEHREIAARAGGDPTLEAAEREGARPIGGGDIREVDPDEPGVVETRARQMEAAQQGQCDHAAGACRMGDVDACNFLRDECGLTDADIEAIAASTEGAAGPAVEQQADPTPFTGKQLGALRRAWGGYKGALADLRAGMDGQAEQHATDAFGAINAIRAEAGQEPIEPLELEAARAAGESGGMKGAVGAIVVLIVILAVARALEESRNR